MELSPYWRYFIIALILPIASVSFGVALADVLLPPPGTQGIAPYALGYSTPPERINVKIVSSFGDPWPVGWLGEWKNIVLDGVVEEAYVPGVVMGELGSVSFSGNPNWTFNGYAWHDEAVKAVSIAARSLGSYKARWLNDGNVQGLDNSETFQAFRPFYSLLDESTKQRYRGLTSQYSGIYLAYNDSQENARYKVNLVDAEYNNDAPNPTVSGWNIPASNQYRQYGYLPSVVNPFLSGSLPATGSRLGAVQLGLQGWAYIGNGTTTFWQLLSHYYPNTQLVYSRPIWAVSYFGSFNNSGCSGNAIWNTTSKWVNYDWNVGSLGITPAGGPDPSSNLPSDNVCMHFSASDSFSDSWYTFYVVADDGFKLLIDGTEIFTYWYSQAPTMYAINVRMEPGPHNIMLKYYEANGRAVARLTWRRYNGMLGHYYDNVAPKGNVPPRDQIIMERFDPTVSFAWDVFSPLDTREVNPTYPYPYIHHDSFSAIWRSYISILPEKGRSVLFTSITDDGTYILLNNQPIIDAWYDQPPTTRTVSRNLASGVHTLQAFYYESGGGATARLVWN